MSASMEEFYSFLQMLQPFDQKPNEIQPREMLTGTDRSPVVYPILRNAIHGPNPNQILSMPTDYGYIKPYQYKKLEDLVAEIKKTPITEKWLIFVNSIEKGIELKEQIKKAIGESVFFLKANNKRSPENKKLYETLVNECRFDCRVLIATTVIYNGINVKDPSVKHIVIPFTTPPVIKQLIGRKRIDEKDASGSNLVNVYFHNVTYPDVRKRLCNLLSDHFGLIRLKNNITYETLMQTNALSPSEDSISKFFYMSYQKLNSGSEWYQDRFFPTLHIPAIYRAFFDTCFYIYTLQRMDPQLENTPDSYIKIILQHLNIAYKHDDIVDISAESSEDQREQVRKELTEILEKLIDNPIVSPDENGSYDSFLNFKGVINDCYRRIHGKNIDSQWKRSDRFISKKKIRSFLEELSLPFIIEDEGKENTRTTQVKRQDVR